MERVDWNVVLNNRDRASLVTKFAVGELSGEDIKQVFVGKDCSGSVRNLVRERGVQEARRIARKALRRRGWLV